MKPIIISIGIILITILASCTNLNESIYSQLTDNVIDVTDDSVVESMMGEAYAQFRYIYWSWNGYFDLCEECSDTYMTPKRIGVGWGDLYVNMHKHTWTDEQGHIEVLWDNAYDCIAYCNKCLDVLPSTGNNQAQMRFLRALCYYMLLDAFRNVPLETTQNLPAGYLPTQSTPQTIFDFCISELDSIKSDLGTDKVYGKPNRYAADMTLAKLYLNANVYLGTSDNTYYEKALNEVNDVINNGGYSLADNYSDNFKADLSNCPEAIFVIPLDFKNASHNYLVNKCLV